ncbi:aliphatic sulfonate ABC transporter substrate-binding protein [Geomicrobium sediminis]|uniref:Sulfonate transport system substrate-binding protein n=1 Tax=Geomicrobium sediminis TaxID=1347788 RepID=A0ABS2PIF4_9BACL|nr:aliphatic sulfonate ABC transporter substrate-binding protein [Geomicrobium sediminis]MBM7634810.1 sulfonate transport system substrate-binding protein [Geomicrobium sediminis]
MLKKRNVGFTLLAGALLLSACGSSTSGEESAPETIRLDYAFYSPTSLVLKESGKVEEHFEEQGIDVEWVLSQGSNRAIELLNSNSVDFGSTAGAAALVAKSNHAPIETVYVASDPEWTALLANGDIETIEDLKGKQVAATMGTDPHIFLLRALHEAGIDESEITIVQLQHNDGASALATGEVDAWAGLDPHMATQEVEHDAELFYRNQDFNTYSVLNVREDFAESHPELVEEVIELYEEARKWTLDNNEEATAILAEQADLSEEVAAIQMERNDFSNPVLEDEHRDALIGAGVVLEEGHLGPAASSVEELVDELLNPTYVESVVGSTSN